MNVTGDINQRNPSIYGFQYTFPNTSSNFPRFNESATLNPFSNGQLENSQGAPFSVPVQTTGSMPFTNNISNSSLHHPSLSPNNHTFSYSQDISPQMNSDPFLEISRNSQVSSLYMNQQLNWSQNYNPNNAFSSNSINNFPLKSNIYGYKRKTELDSSVPLKQRITEERMAQHMSRLHISSQTPSVRESLPVRERRLYMCEEMQRLQTESIIPAQILERMNRPCTALIPWTPPMSLQAPTENNNNNNEDEPNNMNLQSGNNDIEMDS